MKIILIFFNFNIGIPLDVRLNVVIADILKVDDMVSAKFLEW